MDWTEHEVRLIVEDYFKMLEKELSLLPYNKSLHNQALQPALNDRSKGSVEFKHQNISAALINMGLPYINGYKPRFNYQKQLVEREIAEYILQNQVSLENKFQLFAERIVQPPTLLRSYDEMLDEAPLPSIVSESEPLYRPVKINYLEKEQKNRILGEEGEEFVIQYERMRLIREGKERLADQIEWVSKIKGDGLGYDILSRNTNGSDRFIEVKTTKLSKETPIYLSRTEISFASKKEN